MAPVAVALSVVAPPHNRSMPGPQAVCNIPGRLSGNLYDLKTLAFCMSAKLASRGPRFTACYHSEQWVETCLSPLEPQLGHLKNITLDSRARLQRYRATDANIQQAPLWMTYLQGPCLTQKSRKGSWVHSPKVLANKTWLLSTHMALFSK